MEFIVVRMTTISYLNYKTHTHNCPRFEDAHLVSAESPDDALRIVRERIPTHHRIYEWEIIPVREILSEVK